MEQIIHFYGLVYLLILKKIRINRCQLQDSSFKMQNFCLIFQWYSLVRNSKLQDVFDSNNPTAEKVQWIKVANLLNFIFQFVVVSSTQNFIKFQETGAFVATNYYPILNQLTQAPVFSDIRTKIWDSIRFAAHQYGVIIIERRLVVTATRGRRGWK